MWLIVILGRVDTSTTKKFNDEFIGLRVFSTG